MLVAAGYNGRAYASTELYDPATNAWSSAGSLNTARHNHTATLLSSGKVLVTAGSNVASAEVYDPATNAWSSAGSLATALVYHTATLLPSGQVLVAGGNNGSNLASTAIYTP